MIEVLLFLLSNLDLKREREKEEIRTNDMDLLLLQSWSVRYADSRKHMCAVFVSVSALFSQKFPRARLSPCWQKCSEKKHCFCKYLRLFLLNRCI